MKTQSFRNKVGRVGWAWFFLSAAAAAVAQTDVQVVAAWDFNPAGALEASQGQGRLSVIGGLTVTNFLGSASDPAKPNGALSLKGFPPQGTASQSAGLEISIPVQGWKLRGLEFEVRASGTASRRLRVLAARASGDFQELGFHDIRQDGVFEKVNVDLTGWADLDVTNEVRFRLVSDFDDQGVYTGVKPKSDGANSYSAAGTWRMDLVTVTGIPAPTSGETLPLRVSDSPAGFGVDWSGPAESVFTVWEAPSAEGPWEPVVSGTGLFQHRKPTGGDLQFFRVTSP